MQRAIPSVTQRGFIALGLVVAMVLGVIGFFYFQFKVPVHPPEEVMLEIAPGTPSGVIARRLEAAGVIRSARMFRLMARMRGDAGRLQSGEYRFVKPVTLPEVMHRLHKGEVVLHRLTVPEGLRNDEVLNLLAEHTATDAALWREALGTLLDGKESEGLLLPETYTYRKPVRPKAILLDMLNAQRAILQTLQSAWQDENGLRIVASIVEKETAVDTERPLVAAVIRNRLEKRMALQMDPTVIYGLWHEDGNFSGNIRKGDLRRDSPWNTYTRKGLPPTPICNPGAASLRAAADPADVEYLYFVADGSGGHAFASSLEEHNANVQRWMRFERNR